MTKTIWMLWLQGWGDAPDIVRACRSRWEKLNPDWTIISLDSQEVRRFVELDDAVWHLPKAALSDLIRIELLARYGGIWVDATTYCLWPLSTWLSDALTSGFFAFDDSNTDTMISSWFIAAHQANYIVATWRQRVSHYLQGRSEIDYYFWFHRLFAEAYKQDPMFMEIWDSTPKISRDLPHFFTPYETKLEGSMKQLYSDWLKNPPTPMLKLTHKLHCPETTKGSVLRYLLDNI